MSAKEMGLEEASINHTHNEQGAEDIKQVHPG